jgi:DNA (cytosine-5)-methyltransferase 1
MEPSGPKRPSCAARCPRIRAGDKGRGRRLGHVARVVGRVVLEAPSGLAQRASRRACCHGAAVVSSTPTGGVIRRGVCLHPDAAKRVGRGLTYAPVVVDECDSCRRDWDFLRLRERPGYESGAQTLRLVDLFSGCGGLSLGVAEAARRHGVALDIPLAVDDDPDAVGVFRENFPSAVVEQARVEDLFDGELGGPLTPGESVLCERVGRVDALAGGPPCQGHSDLNNHTRRRDPRNALYDRMARAVEVLAPAVALVENVPAVVKDSKGVVGEAQAALDAADYVVAHKTLDLGVLGIPQRRRRHLLVAAPAETFDPMAVLKALAAPCSQHPTRTVRWAIEDLKNKLKKPNPFDEASVPSPESVERIAWLFENRQYDLPNPRRPKCHHDEEHTYRSMYGRLRWDEPAQTVTTGFGSMGQGREGFQNYGSPGKRGIPRRESEF